MTPVDPRAQRAALDHLLALISRTTWADCLILRGSTAMLAWAGDHARAPGDLDWIATPGPVAIHPLDPYPYVDDFHAVQQWPEAEGGATAYELFKDEDDVFETGGAHPIAPPEGTRWMTELEVSDCADFVHELVELLDNNPHAPMPPDADGTPDTPRVRFDPWGYRFDTTWTYSEYHFDSPAGGVRVLFPWTDDDGTTAHVQVDIALDEPIVERPVHALIPRADGRESTLVRTASRELSLAWKLLWLHNDIADHEQGRGKDLYDAVVLAESRHTRLTLPLLRRVAAGRMGDVTAELAPDRIAHWRVSWREFRADHPHVHGDADSWLGRLARAIAPVIAPDPADV